MPPPSVNTGNCGPCRPAAESSGMETSLKIARGGREAGGDKSDGPWRWFRSRHAEDVISGRGGGLCRRWGQEAGPLAAAQPPGPPTQSGWHGAAHQAGWRVSQGTSAGSGAGGVRTLGSPDPISPTPALQHPCLGPFPLHPLPKFAHAQAGLSAAH